MLAKEELLEFIRVEQAPVYITSNGRAFYNEDEAVEYESRLHCKAEFEALLAKRGVDRADFDKMVELLYKYGNSSQLSDLRSELDYDWRDPSMHEVELAEMIINKYYELEEENTRRITIYLNDEEYASYDQVVFSLSEFEPKEIPDRSIMKKIYSNEDSEAMSTIECFCYSY